MKWMGWGWRDLLEAPADLLETIAQIMAESQKDL